MHFESRLADLLGSRLDPPFTGRVAVVPGPVAGANPSVAVGVVEARPLDVDFGSRRPEVAPGADDPRRVVRLECDVAITVTAGANGGRAQVIEGLDALLYLLDHPGLRRPGTLDSPEDDPGFVLDSMRVVTVRPGPDDTAPGLQLLAQGWFWPPEAPGITGEPIAEAHIRAAQLPVSLEPWPVVLRAGDDALDLVVDARGVGTMVADRDGLEGRDFGALAFRVVDAGGRPGAGVLAGGTAGPDQWRIVTISEGRATVEYTPPDEAAVDRLVVSIAREDTGDGASIGIELARFILEVGS